MTSEITETVLPDECSWCGEEWDDTETVPYEDSRGEPICYDCWREHFTFHCAFCWNIYDNEDQHEVLVVWEDFQKDVPKGVYRIATGPYWCDAITDAWLIASALQRIGNIPEEVQREDDFYACGHLCRGCQQKHFTKPAACE